jgi:hypothetical protein
MRKIILAGVAAVVVIGAGAGVAVNRAGAASDPGALLLALNDPPPPGPGAEAPPPPGMPGMPGHPGHGPGWMRGGEHAMARHNLFALFYRPEDKHLTTADVQKIAEGFLLWNGNRDWKVTQVAAGSDGKIDFAFSTADGGVIARFAMDSKTGRIQRLG